jgi:hypothetical protein
VTSKIFMPLEDEGTPTWVEVSATDLGGGIFRVLGPMPTDQIWRFPPGATVKTKSRRFSDSAEGFEAVELSN